MLRVLSVAFSAWQVPFQEEYILGLHKKILKDMVVFPERYYCMVQRVCMAYIYIKIMLYGYVVCVCVCVCFAGGGVYVCVCVCFAGVCLCVCFAGGSVCARACVRVCVHACVNLKFPFIIYYGVCSRAENSATRFCVLSRQCQPFSSQATCFLHVQGDGFQRGQVIAKGERSKRVFIQSNRAQLLDMTPARLTPDLVSHLRSLQIGVDLPRKRSRRGGRRKQKQLTSHSHPALVTLID